jgi:endoglucanase
MLAVKRRILSLFLAVLAVSAGMALGDESVTSNLAKPILKLERGICIDRQLRSIPPEDMNVIQRDDIRLIKSMGFEFVKLIINPAVIKSEGDLDASHIWYLDQVVQRTVDEELPVVVCIHPEPDFKQTVLNDVDEFSRFVSFMKTLAGRMADRWGPDQLAFQLMTEPFACSADRNDWNHWDKLQRQLWTAIRSKMPKHTLILSGDTMGSVDGLFNITPVNDDNVLYCFTFYEPLVFTQQGTGEKSGDMFYLRNLPYPSGPHILTVMPTILASVPEPWKADITRRIEHYAREQWDERRVAARFGRLAEWRKLHGGKVGLWCAEFGCYEAAPAADRCCYLSQVRTLFDKLGIGWCYWSYNETFTVMDANRKRYGPANEQTPDSAVLNALMPDIRGQRERLGQQ